MATVSKIGRLCDAYKRHISLAWRQDLAPERCAVFCFYEPGDELRFRAHAKAFEVVTRAGGHDWFAFDLSDTFAQWLSSQRHAAAYYRRPRELRNVMFQYPDFLESSFQEFLKKENPGENAVVALTGVGSLFGFLKEKEVFGRFASLIDGRLVVFFPGSYEKNQCRLLNGYYGWHCLAVPVSADK